MGKPKVSVAEISEKLGEIFLKLVPLDPQAPKSTKKKPIPEDLNASVEGALAKFYEAARIERLRYQLGVIGRARVAFNLQQRLISVGYPPAIVKQVLFAMLTSAFVGDK